LINERCLPGGCSDCKKLKADVLDAVITAAKAGELDAAIEIAKGADKKPKRKVA